MVMMGSGAKTIRKTKMIDPIIQELLWSGQGRAVHQMGRPSSL
jgi:hypothetical protein